MIPKTMSEPDKLSAIVRAREIISELYIEKPEHIVIEDIATMRGALIKETPMKGADGRLASIGSKGIISIREDIDIVGKKRFVMAHELGHFELHRGKVFNKNCTDKEFFSWYKGNPIEIEANFFAAELLMPEDIFKSRIEGKDVNKDLIESLAAEFNTSLTATSIRYVTLHPEYALVISKDSKITRFIADRDYFSHYINISGKVHSDSVAYDYYNGLEIRNKLMPIETHAWIESKYPLKGQLKELAIPLGKNYNQVLSFLYVEESWDD
jgi:Zn-dependent peptidase ImmA (M78 family)